MPTPTEHFPLPLDLLIGRLEAAGFRVDTSRRLRVLRVFDDLGNPFVGGHFEELKYLLSPLVSRSPQEQERFYEIFDAFWRECEVEAQRVEAGGVFAEGEKGVGGGEVLAKPKKRRWVWWLAAAMILAAAVIAVFTASIAVSFPPTSFRMQLVEGDTLRHPAPEGTEFEWGGLDISACAKTAACWEVRDFNTRELLHRDTQDLNWPVSLEHGRGVFVTKHTTVSALFHSAVQQDSVQLSIECSNPPEVSEITCTQKPDFYQPNTEYEFSIKTEPGCLVTWEKDLFKGDTLPTDKKGYSSFRMKTYGPGSYIDLYATVHRPEKIGYCYTQSALNISVGNDKPILSLTPFQHAEGFSVFVISRLGWLAILLPLLLAGWFFYRWRKKRNTPAPQKTPEELAVQYPVVDAGPYFIPYRSQEQSITVPREFFRIAEVLRRREEGLRRYFDGPATVRATIESGGFPAWRERAVTRPSEYLFLVERPDERDQQGRLFARLCDFLKRRDVPMTAFFHDGSFGHFWNADTPNGLPPNELRRRYPHHRLVLLGAAHGLVNPYATRQPELLREPLDWLLHWPRRLLLTPEPVAAWSFQEALLHRHFLVFPADTEGILSGIDLLDRTEEHQPGRFERWQEGRALRHSPETQRYRTWKTAAEHADYLRHDPECFRWLCALAVCAQPDWSLTLAIGRAIGAEVTHDRLLLLTRIPWLSQNLPNDGLRLDLLRQLSPDDELAARQTLAQELEAVRSATANSFAETERTANAAVQNFALDPRDEAHKQVIRELRALGLLSGSQEAELDFIVQEKADKSGLPNSAGAGIEGWLEVPAPKKFWTWEMGLGLLSLALFVALLLALSLREKPFPAPFEWLMKDVVQSSELIQLNERAVGIAERVLAVVYDLWKPSLLDSTEFMLSYPSNSISKSQLDAWKGLRDSVKLAGSLFKKVASMEKTSVRSGFSLFERKNNLSINFALYRYNIATKVFNFYQTEDLSSKILLQALRNFEWAANDTSKTSASGNEAMLNFKRQFAVDAQHGQGLCYYYLSKYLASQTLPTRSKKSQAVLDSLAREQKIQMDSARLVYESISHNLLVPNYFDSIQATMPMNLKTLLEAEGVQDKGDPADTDEAIRQKIVGYWFYEKTGSTKAISIFKDDGTATMLAYNWENKLERSEGGKWSVENKTLRLVQEGETTRSKITYLDNNRLTLDDGTKLVLTLRRIQPTDRDGDGVLDVVDNCPDEKGSKSGFTRPCPPYCSEGSAENAGCPERKAPEEESKGAMVVVSAVNAVTKGPIYGVMYRLIEIGGKGDVQQMFSAQEGSANFKVSGSRYKILASKPGFMTDSIEINTASRQINPTFTETISLSPQVSSDDFYLPVTLYFDNDQPDSATNAPTTKQAYQPLYLNYIRRKSEYIKQYTTGLSKEAIAAATDSLENFFERDVRGGWNRLFAFTETLYEKLERGDKIELILRGYSDPASNSAYSMNLSARRISSVVNHFMIFDGEILKKFVDSGQLTFTQEPNGERKAPKALKGEDRRRSMYSPEMVRQRRVEIIELVVKNKSKN